MNDDKILVKPARKGLGLVHPIDGPLLEKQDEEGNWSRWTLDAFTLRRIRDGDITQVEVNEPETRVSTKKSLEV